MKQKSRAPTHLTRRLGLSLGVLTCLGLLPRVTLMQRQATSSPMQLVPAFQKARSRPAQPQRVIRYKDEFFVLDYKTSRVLVYDRAMNFERSIGSVGAGPGEFFHPDDFAIRGGLIYVHDEGNSRIQVLDTSGKFLRQFRVPYIRGLAVNSKGEILFGQPEKGRLVSVYSRDGKRVRSFGELKSFSRVYGKEYRDKDAKYRVAINRVAITIDSQDNVYVTFVVAPIIQKYTPEGRLVFETRLQGPSVDLLTHFVVTEAMARKIVTWYMGPGGANLTTWESGVDPRNGNIFVLLPDNSLYVLNGQGKQVAVYTPRLANKAVGYVYSQTARYSDAVVDQIYKGKALMLGRMTILDDGRAFLIILFPPYGIYQMKLPESV